MNTQQALKKCFNYFMDMNHEPGYRDHACVYYANGSDPVRCAVGCLIPARFQRRAGEVDGNVDHLFDEMSGLIPLFADVDKETLYDMQSAHDYWAQNTIYYPDSTTREQFLDHLQTLMCFHESDD